MDKRLYAAFMEGAAWSENHPDHATSERINAAAKYAGDGVPVVDQLDLLQNNAVATGGIATALMVARTHVQALTSAEISGANSIDVRFAFLRSAYRVTVELIPDTELPLHVA